MFHGVAHLSLDTKGRLAVPARYRAALQERCAGRLVITADFDKCLLVYPLPDWEPVKERLKGLSSFNPQTRVLQRLIIGYAEDIHMDNTGRVLISPALREYAGLTKNAVLAGQGNKFELWDKEKWERAVASGSGFTGDGDLPPELQGFSL